MAHRTRGQTSHTYDIREVHSVDLESLTITFTDAAHAAPQTVRVRTKVVTPAARQVVEAMAESVTVHGDGQWESGYALKQFGSTATKFLIELGARGISDLGNPEVELADLRSTIDQFSPSTKRTLNKLLARILRRYNSNGKALAKALLNTSYMVVESSTELYDDSEVEAMKTAARRVFDEVFKTQRELLLLLGVDGADRQCCLLYTSPSPRD